MFSFFLLQIPAQCPFECTAQPPLSLRDSEVIYENAEHPHLCLTLDDLRLFFPNAFKPWKRDDLRLKQLFNNGRSVCEMVTLLGRHPSAVVAKLHEMRLIGCAEHLPCTKKGSCVLRRGGDDKKLKNS